MAQRKPITGEIGPSEDRPLRSLDRFLAIHERLFAATSDLTDEEREALIKEITDDMDEGLRRRVRELRGDPSR